MRNAYKIVERKPENHRPLERTSHRWEDNIKMDFIEVGYKDVDWIHLVQGIVQWGGGSSSEHSNELSGPTEGGKLDQLCDYQFMNDCPVQLTIKIRTLQCFGSSSDLELWASDSISLLLLCINQEL
jgi:hypothetical protein